MMTPYCECVSYYCSVHWAIHCSQAQLLLSQHTFHLFIYRELMRVASYQTGNETETEMEQKHTEIL